MTKIKLDPGDTVKKGTASHLEGLVTIVGELLLGNTILLFSPSMWNPVPQTIIQLQEIRSVTEARTKVFGIVPTLDTAIDVTLYDGTVHQFSFGGGRDGWISEIRDTKAATAGGHGRSSDPGTSPLPGSSQGEFCPFCGKKIGEGTMFCTHCGAKQ